MVASVEAALSVREQTGRQRLRLFTSRRCSRAAGGEASAGERWPPRARAPRHALRCNAVAAWPHLAFWRGALLGPEWRAHLGSLASNASPAGPSAVNGVRRLAVRPWWCVVDARGQACLISQVRARPPAARAPYRVGRRKYPCWWLLCARPVSSTDSWWLS